MGNIAFGKKILEDIENSKLVTNGQTHHSNSEGFGYFLWPGTITIDLAHTSTIKCIRFLLWDGAIQAKKTGKNRIYKYRILTSIDNKNWNIIYDTGNLGYQGWQVFNFPDSIDVRFIKIHGIYNSVNKYFHIVELEAWNESPPFLNENIVLQRNIIQSQISTEKFEGFTLTTKVNQVVDFLEKLASEHFEIFNANTMLKHATELKTTVNDLAIVERSLDSIRREIMNPIRMRLENSEKLGKFSFWGFWVGIIGGLLAIISLIINIIQNT